MRQAILDRTAAMPVAIVAAVLSAVILAGCSGMVVMSPEAWTDAIPASLAALPGKPDGEYRGSYTITLPAGAFAFGPEILAGSAPEARHGTEWGSALSALVGLRLVCIPPAR